jgi:DNA-3-methyladenine glycosylase II
LLAELEVQPHPPFDFTQSLRFLAGFPATQKEQVIAPNRLIKGVRLSNTTAVVDLESVGTTDRPRLVMKVQADTALTDHQLAQIEKRIRFSLSIGEDLTEFYALARQDTPFQETVMPALHGYRQVKFPSPFEVAAWAVLAQRQPMAQARRMKQALVDRFSQPAVYEGRPFEAFPQADDFQPLDRHELASLLGNERRAAYLFEVIAAFLTVEDNFLLDAPYDEVKAWLLAIKGIGDWSATFVLARGLGRMQRALLEDPESTFNKGMLRAAVPVYGEVSFEELRAIAERYGIWQGYWAHFLKAYTEVMGQPRIER